jgi:hypothetical protein
MTIDEAAKTLAKMYGTAHEGDKVTQIHLFGIQFADQLALHSAKEIAIRAGIPESYGTEISKGRRLARFVRLRT